MKYLYYMFPIYVLVSAVLRNYPGVADVARTVGESLGVWRWIEKDDYIVQENSGMVVLVLAVAFIFHLIRTAAGFVEFRKEYGKILAGDNPVRLTHKEVLRFTLYVAFVFFCFGVAFVWLIVSDKSIYYNSFNYYLSVLVCYFMAGSVTDALKLLPLLRLYFR